MSIVASMMLVGVVGLFIYNYYLDKKITKLDKEIKEKIKQIKELENEND